jgi:hypothetical protein
VVAYVTPSSSCKVVLILGMGCGLIYYAFVESPKIQYSTHCVVLLGDNERRRGPLRQWLPL